MVTEAERLAPHSVEAEEAVLGSCLIEPTVFALVKGSVGEKDFFLVRHQMIWAAMAALQDEDHDIDDLTIIEKLKQLGTLAEIGGPVEITRLLNNTPTHLHALTYASVVRKGAVRRQLMSAASSIAQIAQDETTVISDSIDKVLKIVNDAAGAAARDDSQTMGEAMTHLFNAVEDRYLNPDKQLTIPTGFRELDAITGGLTKGALTLVAGRPGMGKTSFALNVATNNAKRGIGVMTFSMEMNTEQMLIRVVSSETGIPAGRLIKGNLNDKELDLFTAAHGKLSYWPMHWNDKKPLFLHELEARARLAYAREHIGLIVVDYIGLLDVAGFSAENTVGRISEISRRLTLLAGELDIPILGAAQLNRQVENRADKRPNLSDLRDSGGLEQDAWLVLFPYRDEYYNTGAIEGSAEIAVAKNRSGNTGTVQLKFDKQTTTFRNVDRIEQINVETMVSKYTGVA